MASFAWVTDPHLNFLSTDAVASFIASIASGQPDGLMLTGDIAEAESLIPVMRQFEAILSCPVYFVLGNHDYYGSSIAKTRSMVSAWASTSRNCHWMPDEGVISLNSRTALIGHGGWGDGQIGDFMGSSIRLNDYVQIEDLRCPSKAALLEQLCALGREAAAHLGSVLTDALTHHEDVILLTHVPPFLASCWYQGQTVLSEWTPHFVCGAVGETLQHTMTQFPDRRLRVYCGHTHNRGVTTILPNLTVYTGHADYGTPVLLSPIQIH